MPCTIGGGIGAGSQGGPIYGRMTSQAQSAAPLPQVRGLAFLGFPLHPAGAPSVERAQHLDAVQIPMLFLQGTRDTLAEIGLLQGVVERLGPRALVQRYEGADHSFHVPARGGGNDAALLARMLDDLVAWIDGVLGARI